MGASILVGFLVGILVGFHVFWQTLTLCLILFLLHLFICFVCFDRHFLCFWHCKMFQSHIFSALGLESDILLSSSWFFVWDSGKTKVWAMWLWLLGCHWLEVFLADRARKYMYVYINTMYVHISINASVCQHQYLF